MIVWITIGHGYRTAGVGIWNRLIIERGAGTEENANARLIELFSQMEPDFLRRNYPARPFELERVQ